MEYNVTFWFQPSVSPLTFIENEPRMQSWFSMASVKVKLSMSLIDYAPQHEAHEECDIYLFMIQ
jgi:hypothetical protein